MPHSPFHRSVPQAAHRAHEAVRVEAFPARAEQAVSYMFDADTFSESAARHWLSQRGLPQRPPSFERGVRIFQVAAPEDFDPPTFRLGAVEPGVWATMARRRRPL